MKKAILIALVVLAAVPATLTRAETGPVTLVINGDNGNSGISISLTPDGRNYMITSNAPLEVGGNICTHPQEAREEILCKAPAIAGFEVNGAGGSDHVTFTSDIPVPATIRGGPGGDRLTGGGASDKILGGPNEDLLIGRRGDDLLLGNAGNDKLVGGPGNDQLRGALGKDKLIGGPGQNDELP
jgi:Ca2+-binding RTX toxin-like protein